MRAVLWLIVGSLFLASTHGKTPVPDTLTTTDLQTQIEAVLKRTRTPGAAIAIVRRGGPEWIAGLGIADVAENRPATPDTLFRIGSTSKGFVALSLLKLAQEGKLDLHDTLRAHAPDLEFWNDWEKSDPVRLVHLLEHTTGWEDLGLPDFAHNPPQEITLRAGLDYRPRARRSRWKPGTRYTYSNAGPAVAAYVVEKITGRRFEDYVRENWFTPLAMPTASYFGTPDVQSRLARNYRADGVTAYPYWKINVRPAGAINASAREMANYLQLYLNRGSFGGVQLLSTSAIARMEQVATTYAAREGLHIGYGLYTHAKIYGGRLYHGHSGGVLGGLCELAYLQDEGAGYVFMINSGSQQASREISGLLRDYLRQSLPPITPPPAPVTVSASARDYAGWYEPVSTQRELTRFVDRLSGLGQLSVGETDLHWHPLQGNARRYLAVNDRHFRREKDPVSTLALIADRSTGTLIQMTEGGWQTWRRVPAAAVWFPLAFIALTLLSGAASVLFALVWVPRLALGRLRETHALSTRVLPLLATLCGAAMLAIFASLDANAAIERLGRLTPWSASLFTLSLAFPVLSIAGLVQALRQRGDSIHRLAWWLSFTASAMMTTAAVYLGYWGIIGLRTWI